jgi:hypothetical protein
MEFLLDLIDLDLLRKATPEVYHAPSQNGLFALTPSLASHHTRRFTSPTGRNRSAAQVSSIATIETALHPNALITSLTVSRSKSLSILEVFLG